MLCNKKGKVKTLTKTKSTSLDRNKDKMLAKTKERILYKESRKDYLKCRCTSSQKPTIHYCERGTI